MITLKTLEQATEQEVFDQAVNHLLTQKEQSISDGRCLYRSFSETTNKPLKCAAGCFISDDEYYEEMEGESWGYLHMIYIVPDEHMELIKDLQTIHDEVSNTEKWEGSLRELAHQKNLKFNWKN